MDERLNLLRANCLRVIGGGVLTIFGIVLPFGNLHAQEVYDATGYVTCDEIVIVDENDPTLNTIETVIYPVGMNFPEGLVVDRWGSDKDITYGGAGLIIDASKNFSRLTAYFRKIISPNDPYTSEDEYSETGVWEIRINTKKNEMSITGQSFVVADVGGWNGSPSLPYPLEVPGAACTWSLVGTAPSDFVPSLNGQ